MSQLNQKQLEKLLSNVKPIDNSNLIQNKKHSTIIREEIQKLLKIKKENTHLNPKDLDEKCNKECFFLFKNYTQIYNLFIKKNLELNIFEELLKNLEKIENGEINQHDASIKVGQLLKSIYIDNVMKEKNDDDANYELQKKRDQEEQIKNIKDISWKQFKKTNNETTSNNC